MRGRELERAQGLSEVVNAWRKRRNSKVRCGTQGRTAGLVVSSDGSRFDDSSGDAGGAGVMIEEVWRFELCCNCN